MLKIPEGYQEEFKAELADKLIIGAQIGCLLIIFLVPLFGILDLVMYPHIAQSMIMLRLILTPVEIVNLLLLRTLVKRRRARKWIKPLSWAILYPVIIILDIIIIMAGGADSPYYAGLNLVLLGMMVIAPWSFAEMAFHALIMWLQYPILMYLDDPTLGDWRVFISNNYFMLALLIIGLAWTYTAHELRIKEFMARKELAQEKERSEQLLLNILPAEVADELKRKGQVEARSCPSATILFTDFAGFTSISNQIPASTLVESLHRLFTGFDEIITRHGLEKLKTIGDAYMCVGGLPTERPGHLLSCVLSALEIIDFLSRDQELVMDETPILWQARIGIHRGPVIAGVIGHRKFAYDVWGDTVNLASRLESASEPGKINVTTPAYNELSPFFVGFDRGYLPVKGKGPVAMTFVERIRPQFSADEDGYYPNAKFWLAVRESELFQENEERAESVGTLTVPPAQKRRAVMQSDLWGELRGLTESDRSHLQRIGIFYEYKLGDRIVVQNEHLGALLVVAEGHVGVRLNQDGVDIDVSILGPGNLIGDMSFVTGKPASASVVAIENVRALKLARGDLEKVMADDVGFASRLHQVLAVLMASRLRETTSRLPPLIVEEVAHTRLHHTMITGRAGSDTMPPVLSTAVETFKDGMRQLDRALLRVPEVSPAHRQEVNILCDTLKRALTVGLNEVAQKGPAFQDGIGSFVFRETFPYFMLSRMIDRSFSKPRGYAGDYYTIELIHHQEAQGDRRLGPLIDAEYLDSPPCCAVRNRRTLMREGLHELYDKRDSSGDLFLITSLASGAGREMFDFMGALPTATSVFASLLDIDIEALTYSSHLATELGLRNQVLFAKENVLHLALGRGKTRLPPQDAIYSIGLADYLKDAVIVRLLNWMYDALKPGGTCVVGNFSNNNPDKEFMDHILDWRLYHRTDDDMVRLFSQSKFGDSPLDIRVEPAGVNLIAFCTRED